MKTLKCIYRLGGQIEESSIVFNKNAFYSINFFIIIIFVTQILWSGYT